ncbi:hypothetical protein [Polyangium aurulentum]|uniref:hypothetical protein n=1 Tax=Polyangium aurulentum TaxID=2567896 RepID=UPI0010AEB367|nr:hypothetical protein [Polyangium aurulentum]UQA61278.1 hypothetical protein E8A73_012685 [Polyangium aurulentum]
MNDQKRNNERGAVAPTAVPKTPALVKRGAVAVIAVGLIGGCGGAQAQDEPQQPPQVAPPDPIPPQAPPAEMTPPQEPPPQAPPPQTPPPQR